MTINTSKIKAFPVPAAPAVQQTFAEVILGRPTAKCKHLGICKIENACTNDFLAYDTGKSENRLYGLASLKENEYFELSFPRSSLSPYAFRKHFGSGYFQLEEDYNAEPEFMGMPIHLAKGCYKVTLTESVVSVRIGL